ncbi:MAG: hypothetical protein ACQEQC_08220 [Elusimicrobiota bacterium]
MYDNKKQIMKKIQTLDKGSKSDTNRYWCVTCKKLFRIDEPVCPYMTKMCVNTPIAIENTPPESSVWMEKMGLFYPNLPQQLMASMVDDPATVGEKWAHIYLKFLKEWKIDYSDQPLQTVKSFVIFASGCESAQRVNEDRITFVITDLGKVWEKDKLFTILAEAFTVLKKELDISQKIELDEIDIIGDRPLGRYYCAMCRKFFEFGIPREKIVCPLMSQKCMFDPIQIDDIKYNIDGLLKMYRISPDLYKRFIEILPNSDRGKETLKTILKEHWKLEPEAEKITEMESLLGL